MWIVWLAGGYILGKYGHRLIDVSVALLPEVHGSSKSWDVLVLAQNFAGSHSWAMCGPVQADNEQEAANQAARQYFGSMTVAKHAMTQSWTTSDGTVFQVRE